MVISKIINKKNDFIILTIYKKLLPLSFSIGKKTNSDIKTTPIPILEKSIFSVTRNLIL
jgi:hypothetical protein